MRTPRRRGPRGALAAITATGLFALLSGTAWAGPAPYFTPLPASGGTQMTALRGYATATALPSGKVLIAGGYDGVFLSSTETFDPAVPSFAGLPTTIERAYAIAAPLPGGNVLLAGGYPTYQLQTAEIFNAATNTTGALPPSGATQPTAARAGAVAAPLPGGKVLIAGGTPNFPPVGAVRSAEIFDAASTAFSALPASGATQLTVARRGAVAAPLPDGKVLIAGGTDNVDTALLRSAEIFDPAANTFTALPASGNTQLTTERLSAVAAALPDGKVLIAGGATGGGTPLATAELFDPATSTFTALPASGTSQLTTARWLAAAAVLPDGTVLITGGKGPADTFLRSAELFVPPPASGAAGGDFGAQTVGQPSAVRTVTLTSLGAQTLTIDAGTLAVTSDTGAAGDFTLVSETCTGKALPYRATCTLDVRFTPAATGVRSARITLADNETAGSATVALTGTGVPVAIPPAAGSGQPAATPPATPAAQGRGPAPKATCRARRSARTGRTRITCTVTGVSAPGARARLSSKGAAIGSARLTKTGRLVITTTRRVRPGSYRLTIGTTKLTVRLR